MSKSNSTLLSSSLEAFQIVQIDGSDVIISVLDSLPIGEGTNIGSNYQKIPFNLFAEALVLSKRFAFKEGIISTQLLSATDDAVLSTAGSPGKSVVDPNMSIGTPGKTGGPGKSAGQLNFFLGSAEGVGPPIKLLASGGNGGAGQTGRNGAAGGNGGPGGNGGAVTFLAGVVTRIWLDQLQDLNHLPSYEQKEQSLHSLLSTIPKDASSAPAWKDAISNMHSALKAATNDNFMQEISTAALAIEAISINYQTSAVAAIDITGGDYGTYGSGSPNGKNGVPGKNGTKTIVLFGKPKDLLTQHFKPFFLIHPSQCARLLDKIRLMYLALNPITDPSSVSNLMILLLRLKARTDLFVAAKDSSDLVKYYHKHELQYGAVKSVEQFRSINTQTQRYLAQLKSGQDSFGYDANHVPLASFNFYKNLLSKLIKDFKPIEDNYQNYFTALKDNTATMEHIKSARSQYGATKNQAESQLHLLKPVFQKIVTIIDSYQTILPPLKQKLEDELKSFQTEIQNHFDFNFDTFIQSLTSLAFAPESKFMLLTQASNFLYQSTTEVTNDIGIPVKKSYLIDQIKAVKSDVKSITEGFKSLNNGTLQPDDPGASKLVAEQQQYMKFISQFKNQFGSELKSVKTAFNNYISKIQDRNNHILNYNSAVILAARYHQNIQEITARVNALNDKALATMQPDLPDLVSFVSRLYYTARNQIMENLDLTARAYRFWALSDRNLISEVYGSKAPPQINYGVLASANLTILNNYSDAVNNFGTNHSIFPANSSSQGLQVKIPDDQVGLVPYTHMLIVKLPVVTPSTKRTESVFAGMANVRISSVRVWVEGVTTSNNHLQIRITQLGHEQIVSPDGTHFTFSHEPIFKLFKYEMLTKAIIEVANFGIQQDDGESSETYAAIGPFASWQIEILDQDNLDLDLSGIASVTLEFHGTNYAFNA